MLKVFSRNLPKLYILSLKQLIGVGTVVSGTLLRGMIKLNDTLMMGPDALGHFQPIAIKSIHRKR